MSSVLVDVRFHTKGQKNTHRVRFHLSTLFPPCYIRKKVLQAFTHVCRMRWRIFFYKITALSHIIRTAPILELAVLTVSIPDYVGLVVSDKFAPSHLQTVAKESYHDSLNQHLDDGRGGR